MQIILNHIGALNRVGLYANREDEVRAAWQAGIAAVAACPNITLKLGGMGMPRMGFDWHTRAVPIGSEELAADMAPWMQYCIEHFGPERCMFESNFPPDKVSFSYHVLYNAFKRLSRAYSPANARRCSMTRRSRSTASTSSRHRERQMKRFAQFLAVCRRSKMAAMGTRRPQRGSCLCRR